MAESLLSPSEILLYGRKVTDLEVKAKADPAIATVAKAASTKKIKSLKDVPSPDDFDGVSIAVNDVVLVTRAAASNRGLYKVKAADWTKEAVNDGDIIKVSDGDKFSDSTWMAEEKPSGSLKFTQFRRKRSLGNKQLEDQLTSDGAGFARIYGFSYEGAYWELVAPVLFLVHGPGDELTPNAIPPDFSVSRAPHSPSYSGVGAAIFQFADDMRVWSYDKADYTIRMDILSGRFEQVLLEMYYGDEDGSPMIVSGGRVSGGRVSGGRVSGGRVSGGRVSGGRAKGPSD